MVFKQLFLEDDMTLFKHSFGL